MHAKPSSIACPYYHHLHCHQVPFQVHSLLGDNGLPRSTHSSATAHANSTICVHFPYFCSNSTGVFACNHPIYKVKMDDGLDTIAHNIFNRFITYKDVTMANKISNPNKIEVRQKLWISLSYNCDPMDGATMVRYDHMVVARSLVKRIVVEFRNEQGQK
uniref:Chitin elicitor-binding protein-like n=1 Tax=Elaeis guineensis var. tenera TaxID=51953 RepID=A0A6I9R3H2_ELAGV|nr:chitin elicitor-binding protein-like [Elaeis guineensis]